MTKEQEIRQESLIKAINDLDKDKAILISEELFLEGYLVKDYYKDILLQCLIGYSCSKSREECLWDLYLRESVINTLIELSSKYILKQKRKFKNKRILVASPIKGLDAFAKIYANYLKLFGYDTIYLGDLLYNKDFLESVNILKPDAVIYNVSSKNSMVNIIHFNNKLKESSNIKTILTSNYPLSEKNLAQLHFDIYLKSLGDMESFEV